MASSAFDLLLFGGTGDLALRKLLPALYRSFRHGAHTFGPGNIVAAARQTLDDDSYRAHLSEVVPGFIGEGDFDQHTWEAFLATVHYAVVDAGNTEDFQRLRPLLGDHADRARVFYLATTPTLFTAICDNLATAGLVTPGSRVVLEKPLGRDLASSQKINDAVGRIFTEDRIFRIDHYLGKESVQNLLALRFGNTIFEPLWSRSWIHNVQITIAEQVGVGSRGDFYDTTGALRDMVQNHLLQCLCIFAMEPPSSIDASAVRDAKLQVLRSLRPFTPADVQTRSVRGQYRAGAIDGLPVRGYLEEAGIPSGSRNETFVALKVQLDNWRWAGVPFYLRTGKRMQDRRAEIVVNFRRVPHSIFDVEAREPRNNQLIIRLQPDEGLALEINNKTPGDGMRLSPISLDLMFAGQSTTRRLDGYERLLSDVIRGHLALFVRRDELEAAWTWIEPILNGWQSGHDSPKPYTAGTWGPAASSALIGRDSCSWLEEA